MQSLIQKTKDKLNFNDSDDEDDQKDGEPDPSQGSVALRIINEGHTPIKIDAWPIKNKKEDGFALATYRALACSLKRGVELIACARADGSHFDDGKLEDGKVLTDDSFLLGSIKKCRKTSFRSHYGWVRHALFLTVVAR